MRSKVIAANWKMNNGPKKALEFVRSIEEWLALDESVCPKVEQDELEIVIFPPFVSLDSTSHLAHVSCVHIGAQNVFWEEKGAYTGEISISMLKEVACTHVLVGHSERRHLFCETDEWASKKVEALLKEEMTPILCVGETLEEKEANTAQTVVKQQLETVFATLTAAQVMKIVIAYEPVWAIGTGKTATAADAQELCGFIRNVISDKFTDSVAEKVRILYGGSVNANNTAELIAQPDIDGLLIGGASVQAASFIEILTAAVQEPWA